MLLLKSARAEVVITAFKAVKRVLAAAVVLLNKHIPCPRAFRLFKNTVKIYVSLAQHRHFSAVGAVFKVDTRHSARQPFKPIGRVAAADLNLIRIKRKAHFVGCELVGKHTVYDLAVYVLKLVIVIVEHKVFAVFL